MSKDLRRASSEFTKPNKVAKITTCSVCLNSKKQHNEIMKKVVINTEYERVLAFVIFCIRSSISNHIQDNKLFL